MSPDIIAIMVTMVISIAGLASYILKAKIAPIEKSAELGASKLDTLQNTLVETLKTITDDNASFRLKYTEDIGDLKLLLSEKYASKDELEKLKEQYASMLERIQLLEK